MSDTVPSRPTGHLPQPHQGKGENFTFFLAMLIVTVFLVMPLGEGMTVWYSVVDFLVWTVTVSGAFSMWRSSTARIGVSLVAVISIVFTWYSSLMPGHPLGLLASCALTLYLALLTWAVLARVFRPGHVDRRKLEAAVATYILLGLTAGVMFDVVAKLVPNAYQITPPNSTVPTRNHLVYFSFVTLTSVGYGDILPLAPIARSLAVLEAIAGQMYVAILIGRLVALNLHYMPPGGSDSGRVTPADAES